MSHPSERIINMWAEDNLIVRMNLELVLLKSRISWSETDEKIGKAPFQNVRWTSFNVKLALPR